MPNNSIAFEPNYSDSLKARFCKQYIPRLKEFLTDFDISQASEDENPKDSLGMGFLVKAYNEMENKEQAPQLKANCKWKIEGVTEKEIYEAIEEFYVITAWKDEIDKKDYNSKRKINEKETEANSVCGQRDKLLEFLFQLKIEDCQANIADTTMFAIADYYGIRNNAKQLGNLYQPYEAVAYAYDLLKEENKDGLYDFRNVLRLFPNLRNAIVHQDYDLKKKIRYHEFIIFSYIGYVLACRRIWKAFNFEKITTTQQSFDKKKKKLCRDNVVDFFCPNNLKLFTIPEESVEINIGSGPKIDVCCKDKDGNTIDVTTISKDDNRYSISISKYKKFTITISDGIHEPLFIEDELDYNAWFYCYKVNLPKEWYPSSKDYETLSEGTKHLIASVSKYVKEGVREDIKECIKQQFAELQPLINNVVEDGKRTEELNNILEKLTLFANGYGKIEEIRSLIEKSNQTIFEELKTLSSKMDGLQGQLSTISDDVKKANDNAQKAGDEGEKVNKTLSNWGRNIKTGLFLVLVLLPIIYAGYNFFANNIETNIYWLRHKKLYWTLVPILICLTFGLTNSWNSIKNIKKEKGKLNYWVTGIVTIFLLGCPYRFSYKNIDSFIDSYDFYRYDIKDNEKVVQLLESCLVCETKESSKKYNEQQLRIKLYEYYDYIHDSEAALRITRPMRNVEQFQKGSQYYARALFKAEKFAESLTIINNFREYYKGISKELQCLEGIMKTFGYGCTQDISTGTIILSDLAKAGNPEAQFYYAYVLSHDISKWGDGKEDYQLANVHHSPYDLYQAVYWFRKAEETILQASLELAQLFASINMTDSALYYYQRSCRGNGDIRLLAESCYRIGLLKEKIAPDAYNDFLEKAIENNYPPALLHDAQRKNDHKTAIEIYKQMGFYRDFRYIPPIVFEYMALDDDSTAVMDGTLQALQKLRPEGHFDMNFVRGMRQMLDTAHVTINHNYGLDWMRLSAKQGCKYAQMICLFKDMDTKVVGSKGLAYSDIQQMQKIAKTIPFANVLLSWLFNKIGAYDMAREFAVKALGKDHHPAGGLMLINIPPEEQHKMFNKALSDSSYKFTHLRYNEMALRVVPSDQKKNCVYMASELDLFNPKGITNVDQLVFWCNVAVDNNMLALACRFMHDGIKEITVNYPLYAKRFFNIILDKVDEKTTQDVRIELTYLLYLCNQANNGIVDELKKEYLNNSVVQKLFDPSILNGIENMELSSGRLLTIIYGINNQVLLDEFSQVVSIDDLW